MVLEDGGCQGSGATTGDGFLGVGPGHIMGGSTQETESNWLLYQTYCLDNP
jgi:hypothetical protein